jgi:phosphoribosylaminoimidazolecarboxamide formyltransferase/IMP cyclohydrolase
METRARLAAKAFARTAVYDSAIAEYFSRKAGDSAPSFAAVGGTLIQTLRYGENPHQSAAFYRTGERRPGVASARQVQGK